MRLAARLTGWKIDIKGQTQHDADPLAFGEDEQEQESIDLFALPTEKIEETEEVTDTPEEGGKDA